MPKEDIQKILYQLGEIQATVKIETKGIHDRLDKLNGKVYGHEAYINKQIGKQEEQDKSAKEAGAGAGKLSGGVSGLITSVVVGVIIYFTGGNG